jgi:hypothetical protein
MAKSKYVLELVAIDNSRHTIRKLQILTLKYRHNRLLVWISSTKPEHNSPCSSAQALYVSICLLSIKNYHHIHSSNILFETFVRFFNQENIASRVNTQTVTLDGWA